MLIELCFSFHDLAWTDSDSSSRGVIAGALENGSLDLWNVDNLLNAARSGEAFLRVDGLFSHFPVTPTSQEPANIPGPSRHYSSIRDILTF